MMVTIPRFDSVGGYPGIAGQGVSFYQLVHPADSTILHQAVARSEYDMTSRAEHYGREGDETFLMKG